MADSDKDGLTDEFERRIGTDPFDKDSDNDGLTDKAERTLGTNPKNFDSDGDGYMDGSEFAQSKSPTHPDPPNPCADRWGQRDKPFRATPDDPDADGLDAMQERMLKTNPNDPDTDGDGIGDGMESIGNRGRSPIKPEPISSPTPAPKSTAIPTADDTLVASNAPMSAGTADPRDAFLGATRAPTDTDDGLTDGPVTSPSAVDDSFPNTDAELPATTVAEVEADDIEPIDDPEPAFDQGPAGSFEPPPVEFASFDSAAADTDTFVANDAFVEDDEFIAEEMSSDV